MRPKSLRFFGGGTILTSALCVKPRRPNKMIQRVISAFSSAARNAPPGQRRPAVPSHATAWRRKRRSPLASAAKAASSDWPCRRPPRARPPTPRRAPVASVVVVEQRRRCSSANRSPRCPPGAPAEARVDGMPQLIHRGVHRKVIVKRRQVAQCGQHRAHIEHRPPSPVAASTLAANRLASPHSA